MPPIEKTTSDYPDESSTTTSAGDEPEPIVETTEQADDVVALKAPAETPGCRMTVGTWAGLQNAVCERCSIHTLDIEWATAHAKECKHKET